MSTNCGGTNAPNPIDVFGRKTGCSVFKVNAGLTPGGNVAPHKPNRTAARR